MKRKHSQTTGRDAHKVERPKSTIADICQVVIQAFLLAGAIKALWVYNGQLDAMKEANVLMKASTDAATKAAKAAEDGITLARETSHLDQRAWVSVKVSGVPGPVTIEIMNKGKTPARKVITRTSGAFGNDPTRGLDFEERVSKTERINSIPLMAPDVSFSTSESVTSEQMPINDLADSGVTFVVFGRIDYLDIFECKHWTTFAFLFDTKNNRWVAADSYNEADHDGCN